MRALILAAGVGSRLRPYTDDRPKPMLPIAGEPILGYNIAMLAAAGFDELVVNLHYLPDIVRIYVGDGSRWGVRVTYSEEQKLLGTAGALGPVAHRFADGTFAVVFGDNLLELDLMDMLDVHRAKGGIATVAVSRRADVSQSGVAEIAVDDRIVRFVEKPGPGETTSHWINAGVVIAQPALLALVPVDRPSDLGRDVLPKSLERPEGLYAYRMPGSLWWFDRIEDYESALDDPRLGRWLARQDRPGF